MAQRPGDSIPQHNGSWSATLGAYRLLNNARVAPEAIGTPVFAQTRDACRDRAVVLCVADISELNPVQPVSATSLHQHSVLAIDGGSSGEVIGLLDQRWFDNPQPPKGETRRQRRARWTRSQVWAQAVESVGPRVGDCRWIHVADREADDFQLFHACLKTDSGWVIRSQHDRYLHEPPEPVRTLREALAQAPAAGGYTVTVKSRPKARKRSPVWQPNASRQRRRAKVQVRYQPVTLAPPGNDPRYDQPLSMYAVRVEEVDPPRDIEPLNWLLLTSEPVTCLTDALRIIEWYRRRWLVEDFHKAQKTGCRLEKSQLHDAQAIRRLAAITAAVAVRLLQMRHAGDDPSMASQPAATHFDPLWVAVVAALAAVTPGDMTVQQFYHTVARYGGWLGRKHDGRPGFQSLWHGWQRIADHVEGILLFKQMTQSGDRCV